jgi:hypothetical protein
MVRTRSGQPPSSCAMSAQQFIGVGGGAQEPLLERALFDGRDS